MINIISGDKTIYNLICDNLIPGMLTSIDFLGHVTKMRCINFVYVSLIFIK